MWCKTNKVVLCMYCMQGSVSLTFLTSLCMYRATCLANSVFPVTLTIKPISFSYSSCNRTNPSCDDFVSENNPFGLHQHAENSKTSGKQVYSFKRKTQSPCSAKCWPKSQRLLPRSFQSLLALQEHTSCLSGKYSAYKCSYTILMSCAWYKYEGCVHKRACVCAPVSCCCV